MNFKQFAARMSARAANLPGEVNEVKKEVTTTLLTSLVETTPIDTGTAVSNYQVDINGPADTVIGAHVPGRYRSTADANIRATIALGQTVIAQVKPGDSLHVTNHIDYIGQLDHGSSAQAPTGMSPISILRARQVIKNAKVIKG